jgi:hypothetical protein
MHQLDSAPVVLAPASILWHIQYSSSSDSDACPLAYKVSKKKNKIETNP